MTSRNPHAPKIKFCGFTRHEDLEIACSLGVDAIGLNFYERSPRYVSNSMGRELSSIAAGRAMRVGVFVNSTPQQVADICEECMLDAVQLHGDEGIEWLESAASISGLHDMPFLRALCWRGPQYPQDEASAQQWGKHNSIVGLLVDAHDPVQRGGTGKVVRWDLLCPRPAVFMDKPFWLAGGLTFQNVQEALSTVRPDGVDLASGIESTPGIMDPELMKLFFHKIQSWSLAQKS